MPKSNADALIAKKKREEERKAGSTKSQSSSVSKQDRINQKMYGDKNGPSTVKKPSVSKAERERRISQNTTTAQRQKMGMPTEQDLQSGQQRRQQLRTRTSQAIKEATSEENRGFMQRQKSGTQTEADKRRTQQRLYYPCLYRYRVHSDRCR